MQAVMLSQPVQPTIQIITAFIDHPAARYTPWPPTTDDTNTEERHARHIP
jgi:hypothetical protein